MGILGRRDLITAIRHALTSVAIFAQLLLLAVPLVEIHDVETGPRTISAGLASSGNTMLAGHESRVPSHNPTTCPACIVQSLHAQVAPTPSIPACVVVECQRFDSHTAVIVSTGPPSAHHSRAPPTNS